MTISTITIDATDYTSYASVAEADAYLAADFARASTWAGYTTAQKQQLLVTATRRFDRLRWSGSKADEDQDNAFPRIGLTDCDGTAMAEDEVPQGVEDGTIVLAAEIGANSDIADDSSTDSNLKRVRAGSVEVEYFRAEGGFVLPKPIFELVSCFLSGAKSVGFISAFGTDAESIFPLDDGDAYYGRSDGFA